MNSRKKIILVSIGFLLGFLAFKLVDIRGAIAFSPEFNMGHVIASATTLLSAVLVTSFLQREREEDKAEKGLLLRQLDEVYFLLSEFEKFKEGGKLTQITASLKKLSMKSTSVHTLLKELNCTESVRISTDFDNDIQNLRKLATDTPIKQITQHAAKAKCGSKVRNGIIELAEERSTLLDTTVHNLKTKVVKAQLAVNKM